MWGAIIVGLLWCVGFCWAILAFGWWIFPWLFVVFVEGWAVAFGVLGVIIICAIFLGLLLLIFEMSGL